MAAGSDQYHEPVELLSDETLNMHRAIVSAIEELEAIDWYQQRAEACTDEDLKNILLHNKNEEIEHVMMTLEWIRRHNDSFSEKARTYLFSTGDITQLESEAEGAPGQPGEMPSLGIGSLKAKEEK